MCLCVYDGIAHGREMLGLERFGEEVRPIVDGLDKGDGDALLLDELAYEEVAPLDVLGLGVQLGAVGEIAMISRFPLGCP